MKTFLAFCLLFSFQLSAQTGGIRIRMSSAPTNCYWTKQKVFCHQVVTDELTQQYLLVDSAFTDDFGWVTFNYLKAGKYQLTIIENNSDWVVSDIQVQDKQLFVSQAIVTESFARSVAQSNQAQYVKGISTPPSTNTHSVITRTDLTKMPSRAASSMMSYDDQSIGIEEVVIMSYRQPLIQQTSISSYTLTRESVNAMNTQTSPISWGETYLNAESINNVYVRGARADANSYYIDGIRVRGIDVPNSMINSIQIYTGGVPANYGDVTGGVISVSTGNTSRAYVAPSAVYSRSSRRMETVEEDGKVSFDRFAPIYENQFLATRQNTHSTFGLDVDRASWMYCNRILKEGGAISRDAVKVEEFINSFPSTKIKVKEDEMLHVEMQRLKCPWNPEHELVAVHLKADDMKKEVARMHHQFVFLIDVSGSMQGADRLELVKEGMKKLVASLDERDRVAIVTYAGYESVALPMTTCDQKNVIYNAITSLGASGSTNGMGGLQMAYDLALKNYDPQANNRVILATDGDFNVGISNPTELEDYISQQRGKGIYLTALGVGMGNYRNDILETLADRGDGNHFYLQTLEQAENVLVKEIGTLITVARDTKMDVQFNPEKVKSYRLLGYENRLMPSEHFRDDTKDGGEIGVNHQVVALYEIELGTDPYPTDPVTKDSLNVEEDDLCAVRLRFKPLKEETSIERGIHLKADARKEENPTLLLAAAFALELRNSPFKGNLNNELLQTLMKDESDLPKELIEAVNQYLKN